jgi:hypothetical protein
MSVEVDVAGLSVRHREDNGFERNSTGSAARQALKSFTPSPDFILHNDLSFLLTFLFERILGDVRGQCVLDFTAFTASLLKQVVHQLNYMLQDISCNE